MVPRRVLKYKVRIGSLSRPPPGLLAFAGCGCNKAPPSRWALEPLKGAPAPSLTSWKFPSAVRQCVIPLRRAAVRHVQLDIRRAAVRHLQ